MKNAVKKICGLVVALALILSVFAFNVSAVSGTSVISFSNKAPKVGDTVTVNITYNLSDVATAVSGTLTFDNSILKYVSANNCTANTIDSGVTFNATGQNKKYYIRIDLEVIAEGRSAVQLIDGACADEESGIVEGSTAFLTTKNAQTEDNDQDINATASAALTSITVSAGRLAPAFDPNVTQYTVTVPYSQTDGLLSCETLDPNASVAVQGERQLQVGKNTRVIVVTNGNQTRRYTVVFNRLDQNGNDVTAPVTDDIEVTVNNKKYIIGQQDALLTPPMGFTLSTATYGDKEVAAYKNSSGKITLLYLLTEDGAGDFFLYENGTVSEFFYISTGSGTYIIKSASEPAAEGLYNATYELNGKTVSCYKYSDTALADFVVFSAVSPDGNSGYYSYDTVEKTIQRVVKFAATASTEEEKEKEPISKSTKTVVISLVSIFVVLLIVLAIALIVRSGKKSGKVLKGIFDTEEEVDDEDEDFEEDEDIEDEDEE